VFTFALNNSNETISVGYGGVVLDQITYGTTTVGTAKALGSNHLDEVENDTAANWCNATATYGSGTDKGTPGDPNATCN
jgi:hypothetical protein